MLLSVLLLLSFAVIGLVAQYTVAVCLGGVTIQKGINRTGNNGDAYEIDLPVAYAVSSWVKTSASVAAGNLTAGHGQTTGTYDVYWTSGGGGRRYGVSVTVTVNALALSGGTGDSYPATADTTVVVCKQVPIVTPHDGDAIALAALKLEYVDPQATSKGHIDMQDSGPATVTQLDLLANTPKVYDIDGGDTNVFSGNVIANSYASHNNTVYAALLKIIILEDS